VLRLGLGLGAAVEVVLGLEDVMCWVLRTLGERKVVLEVDMAGVDRPYGSVSAFQRQ